MKYAQMSGARSPSLTRMSCHLQESMTGIRIASRLKNVAVSWPNFGPVRQAQCFQGEAAEYALNLKVSVVSLSLRVIYSRTRLCEAKYKRGNDLKNLACVLMHIMYVSKRLGLVLLLMGLRNRALWHVRTNHASSAAMRMNFSHIGSRNMSKS